MGGMRLAELIPILQVAIGPVILISGVGLLLLSMTNRLGRVVDRSRLLAASLRQAGPDQRTGFSAQLEILSRRARLIRKAITLATVSVLLAAVLIITLFLGAVLHLEWGLVVVLLFIAAMGCLIGSLVAFLRDINLALAAMELEISSPGH